MSLDAEQVQKVARLARLELSANELPELTRQMSAIIDFVTQLQPLDTADVEPLAHPLPVQNVFRDDEMGASLPVEQALQNAPERRGDFFGVPAVLE